MEEVGKNVTSVHPSVKDFEIAIGFLYYIGTRLSHCNFHHLGAK